jgi:hypothetical protein
MVSIVKHSSSHLKAIARQIGLDPEAIDFCLEAELVQQAATDADIAELRRLRRLQELEVNLAGAEIILRMRRRLLALHAQMEAMAAEMAAVQVRLERELREREKLLAEEI